MASAAAKRFSPNAAMKSRHAVATVREESEFRRREECQPLHEAKQHQNQHRRCDEDENCESFAERLVFAEIGDGETQRIRQNLFVWNVVPEREEEARGIEFPFGDGMIDG